MEEKEVTREAHYAAQSARVEEREERADSTLDDRSPGSDHDITLIVQGKRFPFMRLVLMSVSKVFRGMLADNPSAREVNLSNWNGQDDVKNFENFLELVRPLSEFTISRDNVLGVLVMAHYYDVPRLVDRCDKYLAQHGEAMLPSVIDRLVLSETYHLESLLNLTVDSVVKSPLFLNQVRDHLCASSLKQQTCARLFVHLVNHYLSEHGGWKIATCLPGDQCDCLDTDRQWCGARVLERKKECDGTTSLKVHYLGWPDKWDEWILLTEKNKDRFAPYGTHPHRKGECRGH